MINKSYKIRIYPNKEQKAMIENNFMASHRGWNYLLGWCQNNYGTIVVNGSSILIKQNLTAFSLGKVYTQIKQTTKTGFNTPIIPKSDSRIKSHLCSSLSNAYKRFFKGGGYPRFKSKKNQKYSYTTDYATGTKNIEDRIINNKLFIPVLKYVKFKNSYKELIGDVTSITITREGKMYIASVNCKNVPVALKKRTGENIGIDPNSKKLNLSNGMEKDNPKPDLTLKNKKSFLNKSLSRKIKGSRRFKKVKYTLKKLYRKIKHQREDYINKLSTELINNYDLIAFEKTNNKSVNSFLQGHWNDNAYYDLRNKLKYKAKWYGKEYIEVEPHNTTQRCNYCGHIGQIKVKKSQTSWLLQDKVTIDVRQWKCPICNTLHDRDTNAAINILDKALNRRATEDSSLILPNTS